jgi:hypothetical protein
MLVAVVAVAPAAAAPFAAAVLAAAALAAVPLCITAAASEDRVSAATTPTCMRHACGNSGKDCGVAPAT